MYYNDRKEKMKVTNTDLLANRNKYSIDILEKVSNILMKNVFSNTNAYT